MRWPKYWSLRFRICPSSEHSGLISFRMDRFVLLAVQGTLKSIFQHHNSKASILRESHRNRRSKNHTESLQLQNRYQPLSLINQEMDQKREQYCQPEENIQRTQEPSAQRGAPTKPCRRKVVVGDSLLRGRETTICNPDKMNREVYCLPGAKIHDITERLTRLIKPTDSYPLRFGLCGNQLYCKEHLSKYHKGL